MNRVKATHIETQKVTEFNSFKEAAEKLGVSQSSISNICSRTPRKTVIGNVTYRTTAGGYFFEFIPKEIDTNKIEKLRYKNLSKKVDLKKLKFNKLEEAKIKLNSEILEMQKELDLLRDYLYPNDKV